ALNRIDVLVDGIRCALIPLFRCPELRRNREDEFATLVRKNIPAEPNMPIKRIGFVLREDTDSLQAGINAVRQSEIDDAIDSSEWHSRLCAVFGKRVESFALSASQNEGQSILEDCARSWRNSFHVPSSWILAKHSQRYGRSRPPIAISPPRRRTSVIV